MIFSSSFYKIGLIPDLIQFFTLFLGTHNPTTCPNGLDMFILISYIYRKYSGLPNSNFLEFHF